MRRGGWLKAAGAIGVVVALLRLVLLFVRFDDHHSSSSPPVTFDPTGGVVHPSGYSTGLPSDVLTGIPSIDATDVPTGAFPDAPTAATLGPVRYVVTGPGSRAAVVEYTTADLQPVDARRPRLPYSTTVAGGIGLVFTVYAKAAGGRSITCEIVARHGRVEARRTGHGRHAHVSCEWDVTT